MARAKSNEQGRTKSKPAAIDEIARGIEKLKDLMAQIEDLSREGFPYQDAVRARTELSLRETIRRIFGEKSEEYQTHKSHKLRTSHRTESMPTIAILKQLVARLEQQKLDLLGAKSTRADPPAPSRRTDGPSPLLSMSTLDNGGTADNTSITRTTQPNDTARALVPGPAIPSSPSQPTQAVTGESRGGSEHRTPDSEAPTSLAATTTALHRSVAPPDQKPIAQHESSGSQSTPPAEPLASDLSLPTGRPAEPEPSISRVAVPTAPPATVEGPSLDPATPHSIETTAAPQQTVLSVPVEVAHAPATAPLIPCSQEMPGPLQPRPAIEPHHESTAEMSPVSHPLPIMLTANGDSPSHVPAIGSQPADRSSTGMAVESHEVQPPIKNADPTPKQTRSLSSSVLPIDDSMATLRKVCTRFHLVARQLRLRRDYRATLEVEDEYDVQDLLYALLRLEFEEVGSEEWRPTYGEGAARTSYLLHKDRVVIVAKKTKTGVTAKELAEQVKMDSSHYSGRADCRTLVCFIYDPEGRIGNPRGLESDLTMVSDSFTLEVIIAPK